MIELYMWPTGNGKKMTIMLEECELEYKAIPINIGKGDQFTAEFTRLSPNNKMPAIIDYDVDGEPITMFESGAILQYLAEKTGKFLPQETRKKFQVLQWLHWQMGGFGPMAGQAHHFLRYAPQKVEYAMSRYKTEVSRLYTVLNTQLENREFVADAYSIADIAIWPWVARYEWQEQDLNDFPEVKRWFENIEQRPAVQRALEVGKDWADFSAQMSDADKKKLFGLRDKDL
ncbi:glutathione binding-like protein [Gammaproteobacteria bacterium]|nr:glutathione binding-like protein [Gammaproteobacteria bacterium]